MLRILSETVLALLLCGTLALRAAALTQGVEQEPAAGPISQAQGDNARTAQQPAEDNSSDNSSRLGQGTKAQAEHSAEATAHKSVNDPNNQLGTSLQGRTRPIVGAVSQPNGASTSEPASQ
jgi:hypothetical protein